MTAMVMVMLLVILDNDTVLVRAELLCLSSPPNFVCAHIRERKTSFAFLFSKMQIFWHCERHKNVSRPHKTVALTL